LWAQRSRWPKQPLCFRRSALGAQFKKVPPFFEKPEKRM
jgi:hypothetical protein